MTDSFDRTILYRYKIFLTLVSDTVLLISAAAVIKIKHYALEQIDVGGIENHVLTLMSITLDVIIVLYVAKSILSDVYEHFIPAFVKNWIAAKINGAKDD